LPSGAQQGKSRANPAQTQSDVGVVSRLGKTRKIIPLFWAMRVDGVKESAYLALILLTTLRMRGSNPYHRMRQPTGLVTPTGQGKRSCRAVAN
jgi:hypothetical protein